MLYLSGRFLFFCVFIFLASVETFASNQIFFYVPEPVELNGKLERQTFPGLPNYESILSGDAPERGL